MVGCSVRNCKNRSEKGSTIRFFSFPKEELVAKEWLLCCGSKTKTKYGRICSEHFQASDYINPLQYRLQPELKFPVHVRHLKPDAIPSLKVEKKSKNSTDNVKITRKTTIADPLDNDKSKEFKLSSESNDASSNECQDKIQVLLALDADAYDKSADEAEETSTYIINVDRKTNNDVSEDIENSDAEIEIDDDSDQNSHSSSPAKSIEMRNDKVTIPVSEYKLLKEKYNEYHVVMHNLEQIFTPGQIRSLMDPYRHRVQWSAEDITAALTLRRISAASYRHLRAIVGIPLPGFSTLRRWAAKHGVSISEQKVSES